MGWKARQYTESPLREECELSGEEDENEIFRKAMHGVQPLVAGKRAAPPRRRPPPRARFARAERDAVLRESLGPPDPQLDIQPGGHAIYPVAAFEASFCINLGHFLL